MRERETERERGRESLREREGESERERLACVDPQIRTHASSSAVEATPLDHPALAKGLDVYGLYTYI